MSAKAISGLSTQNVYAGVISRIFLKIFILFQLEKFSYSKYVYIHSWNETYRPGYENWNAIYKTKIEIIL